MKLSQEEMVKRMRAWCEANYSRGADTMVECWCNADYVDLLDENGGKLGPAMKVLRSLAEIYSERQADAVNSAF